MHEAFATEDTQHILEELGDIMFVVVNMCRHLDADPEQVMRAANEKFEVRFRHMEAALHDYGKDLSSMEIDDLEAAWQSTKKRLKQSTT